MIAPRQLSEIRVVTRRRHLAQRSWLRIAIRADQFGEAKFARGRMQLGKIERVADDDGREIRCACEENVRSRIVDTASPKGRHIKLTSRPVSLTFVGLYQRETVYTPSGVSASRKCFHPSTV